MDGDRKAPHAQCRGMALLHGVGWVERDLRVICLRLMERHNPREARQSVGCHGFSPEILVYY